MVAWSSSGSISCFKVQSSIGHLVWFFVSGNSIVSGVNLWCPCAGSGRFTVLYSVYNILPKYPGPGTSWGFHGLRKIWPNWPKYQHKVDPCYCNGSGRLPSHRQGLMTVRSRGILWVSWWLSGEDFFSLFWRGKASCCPKTCVFPKKNHIRNS